jgi:GT2 family glycosyltransferase
MPHDADPMNLPTIGILVLNRNGSNWLAPLYESIRAQQYPCVRIYLVDNASDDGSVELTLKGYPEVTVLRLPQNLGYCMAYNAAMPQAFNDGCAYVIWANNDIRFEPGCLEELARTAASDPRIGVLGPAFLAWEADEPNYYMLGNYPHAISAMKTRSTQPIPVDWVEGSLLMVSHQCVQGVGPLDPYLYFYWEEADFCRRARYQGWSVVLVPSAVARHYAGGWSATDAKNEATANHLKRRNFYIYRLANPFNGFGSNIIQAMHVFLVVMKEAFFRYPSSFIIESRIFLQALCDIRVIRNKWRRDVAREKPPSMQPSHRVANPEVITRYAGAHPPQPNDSSVCSSLVPMH